MKLIFIHYSGTNYKGENVYEFLFSDNIKDVMGDNWDSYPANGNPQPPKDYVKESYVLVTDIEFELIQNHTSFDMFDAVEDVIPLAWEDTKKVHMKDYPDKRMFFKYGDDKEEVINKLYNRDIEFKS